MVSFLVSIYYNVIIAWVLFYMFASFRSDVPWRTCDPEWATKYCFVGARPKIIGTYIVIPIFLPQIHFYCRVDHVNDVILAE